MDSRVHISPKKYQKSKWPILRLKIFPHGNISLWKWCRQCDGQALKGGMEVSRNGHLLDFLFVLWTEWSILIIFLGSRFLQYRYGKKKWVFLNGPTPTSFCLFLCFFSITNYTEKTGRLQRDLNSDRQSRRQACRPLDHHHGPKKI